MRIAYKAFNADLTCTMGKGVFQYEPGKWYEEPEANCVKNGFHCAANPLDTLDYYYNWDSNQYWLVEVEGDMDEDGSDTKISATRIRLLRRLSIVEFITHAVSYIVEHPHLNMNCRVKKQNSKANPHDKFVFVRNEAPAAMAANEGQYLVILKDDEDGEVQAAALYLVDGKEMFPGVWYNVEGRRTECSEKET